MMATSGYPKRVGPSPCRGAVAVYGFGFAVAFAVAFAIIWFAPSMIWVLLLTPLLSFVFERVHWRNRLRSFAISYIVIAAAGLSTHLIR